MTTKRTNQNDKLEKLKQRGSNKSVNNDFSKQQQQHQNTATVETPSPSTKK